MFSIYHFIWLGICAAVIVASLILVSKKHYSLTQVLTVACIVCILSEVVKVFSVMQLVQGSDGTYHPYIANNQLPFHLCSIQIILIFYVRFTKNEKMRTTLLGFMYPTCLLGGLLAIAMPSIFNTTISANQAFTHPIAYQTFLYHAMLIVLSISIIRDKSLDLKPKNYFITCGILGLAAFLSIYLNSIFANVVYEDGALKSVEFTTNFFFTYVPPLSSIKLTTIGQWYLYFGVLIVLGIALMAVSYIPVFLRAKKSKLAQDK